MPLGRVRDGRKVLVKAKIWFCVWSWVLVRIRLRSSARIEVMLRVKVS
jgi:hypothetical protein